MEHFSLFVDGKDVDTGKYEYFPYADQTILDFKKTYQIITKLKKGEVPEDTDKYIYARYCVGDNELNKKAIDSAYKASKIMRDMPIAKRRKILLLRSKTRARKCLCFRRKVALLFWKTSYLMAKMLKELKLL